MSNLEKVFGYACDEIDDAEKYAYYASKQKAMGDGMLSGIAIRIAGVELEHAKMWYDAVQQIAKDMRTEHQKMGKEVPEFFEDRLKSMAECYTKKMSKVMYMIDLNK